MHYIMGIEFKGAGDQPAAAIHDQLLKKGYIASLRRGNNTLRIDPPLTIKETLLDKFVGELNDIINESHNT
jgi:4-aminobutyrate aminotransferase-like enzyme